MKLKLFAKNVKGFWDAVSRHGERNLCALHLPFIMAPKLPSSCQILLLPPSSQVGCFQSAARNQSSYTTQLCAVVTAMKMMTNQSYKPTRIQIFFICSIIQGKKSSAHNEKFQDLTKYITGMKRTGGAYQLSPSYPFMIRHIKLTSIVNLVVNVALICIRNRNSSRPDSQMVKIYRSRK